MQRVTGIGGIFFKAQDPEAMYAWYEKHLGIQRDPVEGVCFKWRAAADAPDAGAPGMTVWSIFKQDTTYFKDSRAPFMLNYRVADLDAVLAALTTEGVTVHGREDSDYGRFAWISDPEGNRIELWQPPEGM